MQEKAGRKEKEAHFTYITPHKRFTLTNAFCGSAASNYNPSSRGWLAKRMLYLPVSDVNVADFYGSAYR